MSILMVPSPFVGSVAAGGVFGCPSLVGFEPWKKERKIQNGTSVIVQRLSEKVVHLQRGRGSPYSCQKSINQFVFWK